MGKRSVKVKIGIIGSRFQADCIAASVKAMPEEMEVVAVASPTKRNAEEFARRHGIPRFYSDYREMLNDPAIVYTTTPQNMMKYVDFMQKIGAIKVKPETWKDALRRVESYTAEQSKETRPKSQRPSATSGVGNERS